jgi:hypothetical protein
MYQLLMKIFASKQQLKYQILNIYEGFSTVNFRNDGNLTIIS